MRGIGRSNANLPQMFELRRLLEAAPQSHWAGFQVYYSMQESEVRGTTGVDVVESVLAVFCEVAP
jgi:hypothetical protein